MTDDILEWATDLPPTRWERWDAIVAELKMRPGEWARVPAEVLPVSTAQLDLLDTRHHPGTGFCWVRVPPKRRHWWQRGNPRHPHPPADAPQPTGPNPSQRSGQP